MSGVPSSTPSAEDQSPSAAAARWRAPPCDDLSAHPVFLYNSLTRSKSRLVPQRGRQLLWYMCGPTVYDSSHMGHARTYVCFDVMRRVLRDYFQYAVVLTMNITDIDDKIIRRSSEAGVPFTTLAREHEKGFLSDMTALGVAPPDVLTRVSEYVPEIVAYIERIIRNGYAYESNGSVYFSVAAFRARAAHFYAKLVPENFGNSEALAEGEGVLCSAGARDKVDAADFALWKASKPDEPWWESPWGRGRPGWHIECSAMCHETLGSWAGGAIDVHSGGCDLRFPHHDNEIAQSEAYLEADQWVNYFVHTGHLNIDGLKMSKSLKNFVKIGAALERYGARQLRLLFLMYRYNAPMDYSEAVMEIVAGVERPFDEFFQNVKVALRSLAVDGRAKWAARELAFAGALEAAKAAVHAALCDDIDTPSALEALRSVVKDCNKYMTGQALATGEAPAPAGWTPVPYLLRAAAEFVTKIFRIFGLVDPLPPVGYVLDGGSGESSSREATLSPYLDVLANFRESGAWPARFCSRRQTLSATLSVAATPHPLSFSLSLSLCSPPRSTRRRAQQGPRQGARRLRPPSRRVPATAGREP